MTGERASHLNLVIFVNFYGINLEEGFKALTLDFVVYFKFYKYLGSVYF